MGKRETSTVNAAKGNAGAVSRDATPSLVFGTAVDAPRPATALRRGCWKSIALGSACAVACLLIGSLSAAISAQDDWYLAIRKPYWMPPGWLFGVVWSALYLLMGVALALILDRGWETSGVKRAAILFAIQLAVNFAWSPVFFRFQSPSGAMIVIVLLWLIIGWTVAAFWSVRDVAGTLLLPYWLWVTFAVALNAAIWRAN